MQQLSIPNSSFTDVQGHVTVMVEQRSSTTDTFGQGRKAAMQFHDFLKAMKQGDSSLYMSTQEVCCGSAAGLRVASPYSGMIEMHFLEPVTDCMSNACTPNCL